jgi:hypothetical protein
VWFAHQSKDMLISLDAATSSGRTAVDKAEAAGDLVLPASGDQIGRLTP